MAAKIITAESVADLRHRIEQGETPKKNTEISAKEFIKLMMPHVKSFLAKGYTYKEIAEFFGHVSVTDLKKAVAKDAPETKTKTKESAKAVSVKSSARAGQAKQKQLTA